MTQNFPLHSCATIALIIDCGRRSFMKVVRLLIAASLLIASSISAAPPANAPAVVDYHRTGGFIGVDDRAELLASGEFTVRDRQGTTWRLQLSSDEVAKIEKLFAGWKDLARSYHSRGAAPDAYAWTIAYRGTSVAAAESDPDIPKAFVAARDAIETLIRRAAKQ
jgi:hypothetical protein